MTGTYFKTSCNVAWCMLLRQLSIPARFSLYYIIPSPHMKTAIQAQRVQVLNTSLQMFS